MKAFQADDILVLNLQNGDVRAFDLLYEKYAGRLYGFSIKYLKSKTETEELVQSVFLKIWENHKNLKKESSFKSYLFTIAYHEICNTFRRRCQLKKFIGEQLIDKTDFTVETEEQIDFHSVLAQVVKIIAHLPERQKTVFLKKRMEGKSSKEIAEELGISVGTVDNYISDSLKYIRKNLANTGLEVVLLSCLFFN